MKFSLIAVAALALSTGGAFAQNGDPVAGEAVFKMCQGCHAIGETATNRVGPVLEGVVGRTAGTFEGYNYSAAMKEKGAEGLVWEHDTLDAFLTDPKDYVPGTKMTFRGLPDAQQRADVIAFLTQHSPNYVPPAQ